VERGLRLKEREGTAREREENECEDFFYSSTPELKHRTDMERETLFARESGCASDQ
jgi:hypothetical protein